MSRGGKATKWNRMYIYTYFPDYKKLQQSILLHVEFYVLEYVLVTNHG